MLLYEYPEEQLLYELDDVVGEYDHVGAALGVNPKCNFLMR